MFTLEFYETPNRITPLEEFLNDLKMKDKSLFAKVLRDMELLEWGPAPREAFYSHKK